MEYRVDIFANPEFEAIAILELVALHALSVYERAMPAACIYGKKSTLLGNNLGVLPGDAGVSNDEIAVCLATHSEWTASHEESALCATLHHQEMRKYSSTRIGAGTVTDTG